MVMKVLITGGAGFIGDAVARHLAKDGFNICILDTEERLNRFDYRGSGISALGFNFTEPISAEKIFSGADTLLHLGWTTDPLSSMKAIAYDARTNIVSSIRLFEAAVNAGIENIVFASSGGTVYGAPGILPVREDDIKSPLCAYGVSKLAVEQYLDLYHHQYGIRAVSLRPGNPYGPFQLSGAAVGIIARYLNQIGRDEPLQVWGDGGVIRDYLWIGDLVRAFKHAIADSRVPSGSYNIGSGRGCSINELIEVLFTATGRKVPVDYSEARSFDVPSIVLCIEKFSAVTGWKPETDLFEGAGKLWNYYLRQAGLTKL